VLFAEFGDDGFGDAELFALALYYGMLEAGGFGEDEERFCLRGREKAWRHGQARACGGNVAKKFAAIAARGHFLLLARTTLRATARNIVYLRASIERVIFGESESVYRIVPPKLKARLTTVVQELRPTHIPIWLYILRIP
jgi:hypothetical protein